MEKYSLKLRLFNIINKAESGDRLSKALDLFIIWLILLNVLAVLVETVDSVGGPYQNFFRYFEYFSIAIFTVEYLLRLWTCTYDEQYMHPTWGRLRYIFSWSSLIDLLAIIPFYLPVLLSFDSRGVRALRLFRLLRLLKLGRYSKAVKSLGNVLKDRKEELVITFSGVMVLLVISSTFMYYIENEAQPGQFSSIPATMWWGVATLTTVGYGDITPVTDWGKFLGAVIAILGIGAFAVPAGILATGFESVVHKRKSVRTVCPECGHEHTVELE